VSNLNNIQRKARYLNSSRLSEIQHAVKGKMVLALHGTTGVPADLLRECISKGIRKVNVNKVAWADYTQHMKANSARLPLTEFMEQAVNHAQKGVENLIDICGSAGKGAH
jgi:fructose-bisphosphate aldolase class II